jgi:flagellar basal-body rod protein FlgB
MTAGLLGDPVSRALSFALNGLSKRQQVVSNNVANVDTPGFSTSRVPFEDQLKTALSRDSQAGALFVTNVNHIQRGSVTLDQPPSVVSEHAGTGRIDGNSVDIEREMFQLADTTLRYQATARVVSERIGWLRAIINGGR